MLAEDLEKLPKGGVKQAFLSTGEAVFLRPIREEDGAILAEFFESLSDETRGFYSPHSFDQETADRICLEAATDNTLRILGILETVALSNVIAYFIVTLALREKEAERFTSYGLSLDPAFACSLAPSVSDRFQNTGVGSTVMAHMVELLRMLGKKHIVLQGGVQEKNQRAVHFYEKFGFEKAGEFQNRINNYDMVATL